MTDTIIGCNCHIILSTYHEVPKYSDRRKDLNIVQCVNTRNSVLTFKGAFAISRPSIGPLEASDAVIDDDRYDTVE